MPPAPVLLPVALAAGAALLLALAAVLQQSAASAVEVGPGPGGTGRFVRGLLARPRWLLGQLVGAVGITLFALALHTGQVVVVQPVLATQLVFSLLLVAAVQRRTTGRWGVRPAQWGGAALVVSGLAVFLVAARPDPGRGTHLAVLAGVVLVVLTADAVVVATSARTSPERRPLVLALAAGAGFGVDALLMKEVTARVAAGHLLSWPLVALAVLATTSVVLAQRAFQCGSIPSVLPVITTLEPLVALSLAGPVFGEHLASGGGPRLGQLLGVLALVLGVALLARGRAAGVAHGAPAAGVAPPAAPGTAAAAGAAAAGTRPAATREPA